MGKPEIARLAVCQLAARFAQLALCAAGAGFDAASGISFSRDASTDRQTWHMPRWVVLEPCGSADGSPSSPGAAYGVATARILRILAIVWRHGRIISPSATRLQHLPFPSCTCMQAQPGSHPGTDPGPHHNGGSTITLMGRIGWPSCGRMAKAWAKDAG